MALVYNPMCTFDYVERNCSKIDTTGTQELVKPDANCGRCNVPIHVDGFDPFNDRYLCTDCYNIPRKCQACGTIFKNGDSEYSLYCCDSCFYSGDY